MSLIFNHEAITKTRKAVGMTQADLARELHCKRQSISQIESGFHKPNIRTLEKIWAVLGVSNPAPFFVLNHACVQTGLSIKTVSPQLQNNISAFGNK